METKPEKPVRLPAHRILPGLFGMMKSNPIDTIFCPSNTVRVREELDGKKLTIVEITPAPIIQNSQIRFDDEVLTRGDGVAKFLANSETFTQHTDWLGRRVFTNKKLAKKLNVRPKVPAKWQCKVGHVVRKVLGYGS